MSLERHHGREWLQLSGTKRYYASFGYCVGGGGDLYSRVAFAVPWAALLGGCPIIGRGGKGMKAKKAALFAIAATLVLAESLPV
jgi:hypothetical protein